MRFALVNSERVEAAPKQKGLCPGCGQPVTAKSGEQRIRHWAHDAKKNCDRWWEPETEWHRAWKNQFPQEWQEIVQHDDSSGEKHIADVRTKLGLVLEFQHSYLNPQERATRENFYGNMVWIVNGTRLKRDYSRFLKGKNGFMVSPIQGEYRVPFPDECFPIAWLDSEAPVIFDFQGAPSNQPDGTREYLWCLLPGRAKEGALIRALSRNDFVAQASSSPFLFSAQIRDAIRQLIKERQLMEERNAQRSSFNQQQIRRLRPRGYGRL